VRVGDEKKKKQEEEEVKEKFDRFNEPMNAIHERSPIVALITIHGGKERSKRRLERSHAFPLAYQRSVARGALLPLVRRCIN